MNSGKPSRTSEATTAVRAREATRSPADRICYDPYAVHFLSPFYRTLRRYQLLGRTYGWIRERICPGLRGGILARSRYMDERVTASLRDGIEQVVILGAGYDSRGYRLLESGSGIPVFEVDHPATQRVKVAKVRELFGEPPGHVRFVPVDFCRDDLGSLLRAAGYDRDKRTLFIWEGVIYYLDAGAVDALLAFVVRESASGSSITFDCFPRSVVDGTCRRRESRNLRRLVAKNGEPLRFGLDVPEIAPFLKQRGFSEIETTGSSECKKAWFHGANRSIAVSEIFSFVHATHYRI